MEEDIKMVGIIHIYSLFNKKDFKEGTAEKRIAMLYAEYERCCEKKFHPDWRERWKHTLPFVKELVDCDMQVTKLLITETTWNGRTAYNYQILNLEEIKHNERLVTLWISIQHLWGYKELADYLYMRDTGFDSNKAIQNSMEQFYSKNNDIRINWDVVRACTIRYFNIFGHTYSDGMEAFNNSTSTRIVEALIY